MNRVVVLGAGESGVGAAILAKKLGMDVFVSDKSVIKEKYSKQLEKEGIAFESGQHTTNLILNANVVVKSPGIPDHIPFIKNIIAAGIPVISEIEFAATYSSAEVIGITGSNGKTTTTMLTHHLLKQAGYNVGIGGNIGDSYAEQVANQNFDKYVLELSSFQLDGIESFRPHIAMITNITPDHLDRYEYDFEQYIASKFRITKNQKSSDYLIYDADDPVVVEGIKKHKPKAQLVPFSLVTKQEFGAYVDQNDIVININKEELRMSISKLSLQGKHNTKNAMAATLAAQLLKARKKTILESLENFEGAEHRLEHVLKVNGVEYINDSKATNVNATFYALECMNNPTVWIVGGVDKGNDYAELYPLVREKVKAIICLGLDNTKIKAAFGSIVDFIEEVESADAAVKIAYKLADKGETVLLSPACASFDLFESYEDRGRKFKDAVRNL
ncbi:UDP-N-acetylmuramoyl-L-alanine--D-glutamate ligase [Wenyingzhuangia aestuarii]|uniref:UDP-N-acetylmuramoyl-L-alanine--D-glutamate ligase n=1 Tax=Wenyingzhuangia aestuarii TaxID=1647582 RepID=UPI00143B0676|nr:UDP-N-acetylmuramoyl-L-alanine--D-glutamate ligase [Wenyingzhuangia aestuarii]NJB81500.1 UDP-N-acetylmuramoylalanine--D-glutamate ligase [Wenyingzhuangia aestuarii]